MTNTVTIYSTDELEKHKTTILSNLAKSVWDIRAIIESENAQEVFRQFKFEKIATEKFFFSKIMFYPNGQE